MQNLIRFFIQYGNILIFIILELICFTLIIDHNQKQRDIFSYSKDLFTGRILEKTKDVKNYLRLTDILDSLSAENANLRAEIRDIKFTSAIHSDTLIFEKDKKRYEMISAEVISNSVHLRNNKMLINKGKVDGVSNGLGVLVEDGIVGVVVNAGDHYSSVMPIANTQSRISAAVRRTNYFGILRWNGTNPKSYVVEDVPIHADVLVDDTIITSGYSTIFPRGIELGTVSRIDEKGGSTYELQMKVKVDLSNLRYVYVINMYDSPEIDSLQN